MTVHGGSGKVHNTDLLLKLPHRHFRRYTVPIPQNCMHATPASWFGALSLIFETPVALH